MPRVCRQSNPIIVVPFEDPVEDGRPFLELIAAGEHRACDLVSVIEEGPEPLQEFDPP